MDADCRRRVAAVVLAAGEGRRFEGTKQLADVAGRPLVTHAVATAHVAGIERVLVVVGHDADAVADAARRGGDVEVVVNPRYREGQSTSLRAAVASLMSGPGIQAMVVLLADQPGVCPQTVRKVLAALDGGADAARAQYLDGPGHPVAFSRGVFGRLERLRGDTGARQLLAELEVTHVSVPTTTPRDVDTRDDLRVVRRDGIGARRSWNSSPEDPGG